VRRRDPTDVIRLLLRMLQRTKGYRGGDWKESLPPPLVAPLVVVVDGLATCSTRLYGRDPWLVTVRSRARSAGKRATFCGFSYSEPGKHYGPPNTRITFAEIPRIFRPYEPDVLHQPTYLCFSLGADIVVEGLTSILAANNLKCRPDSIRVVLVQPAFGLTPPYLAAAAQVGTLPAPLSELVTDAAAIRKRLVSGVASMVARGVDVTALYWSGDRFADMAAMTDLEQAGAHLIPVSCRATAADAYLDHCAVANDDSMLRQIDSLL
jgi:hypothetical protein